MKEGRKEEPAAYKSGRQERSALERTDSICFSLDCHRSRFPWTDAIFEPICITIVGKIIGRETDLCDNKLVDFVHPLFERQIHSATPERGEGKRNSKDNSKVAYRPIDVKRENQEKRFGRRKCWEKTGKKRKTDDEVEPESEIIGS